MRISGNITINNTLYKTEIKDMKDVEVLGNGTCGHVVKMRHLPSSKEIAVKVCNIVLHCSLKLQVFFSLANASFGK